MAIKFLRGIYGRDQVRSSRPIGFEFPLGLGLQTIQTSTANSANSATAETFDILVVAGGAPGGGVDYGDGDNGGGGAGGVRILSGNSFTELTEYKNSNFLVGLNNTIPVVVGGASANSCFGSITTVAGGRGGTGFLSGQSQGRPGGSGGGGGKCYPSSPGLPITGGSGIPGQGFPGCNGTPSFGGNGGSALCTGPATSGITSSITGTAVRYGDGGASGPPGGTAGTANRGNGGQSNAGGGSGIVAIRYRNPAAPTTPLATGGDCICCTSGCIIHIFNSSGFLNVNTTFSIN